ncbi:DUF4185 domain-containing protein [Flavobacteriaceae bacterium F89]|uniref:DUF4185 domain-containing protein n=1 Tax=Cerina litoralis TaxID=2874477 RepID=A0AAE3EV30_9FLAO|nr:hypothetical protein [Cerina litoralis]MCG2461645.1 DUF4185 domain-containing protein [Cerina litoralis]
MKNRLYILIISVVFVTAVETIYGQSESASSILDMNYPYPKSTVITGFVMDTVRVSIGHGDNWAITWAGDGKQYSFFTDGTGFGLEKEVSTAPVIITGNPPEIHGSDIKSPTGTIPYPAGQGSGKVSGLLAIKGVLYALVRNLNPQGYPKGTGSTLMYSGDFGKTWNWVNWDWPEIGYPSWLNAGREYSAASDDFAYFISPDGSSAYADYSNIIMGRVHKDSILFKQKYTFYKGISNAQSVLWGTFEDRAPIFTDPQGCFRPDIVYNEGLDRYFLLMSSPYGEWDWWANENPDRKPHLGIFDAPDPWGPWTTVAYVPEWGRPENRFAPHIPSKWISRDGKEFYLLYSCIPNGPYQFNIQKCTVKVLE